MSIAKFKDICRALDVDADYILFGISSHNADSILNKYIKQMTEDQIVNLVKIVKAYSDACGINEE